ncbi:alpha/beta hydrolase [Hymenobacter negativus]|uniref:Alpha/beta hydrolase n=1 Tax=Hymenobacter negativus TaxID=2795026 RepID=A0ABS3QLI8_9BACT|nr:hypothetical protein [Hymenobacter negativus]MBO2012140.1 hypothetical protein [Hymenobacter negativus]
MNTAVRRLRRSCPPLQQLKPTLAVTTYQDLRYIYQPARVPAAHTLLLLHGTGGDEYDLLPLASHFGPALNVLSLRGNALENGMPRFFRRLATGHFDEEDVIFRTHELVQFVHLLSEREGFDVSQLVALGYSNGANMAGALLLLYPELLAGAILWRPMQPLVRHVPAFCTNRHQSVLFQPGIEDSLVQLSASACYAALLKQGGFELHRQDANAGHNLLHNDLEAAVAWFYQHFRQPTLSSERVLSPH